MGTAIGVVHTLFGTDITLDHFFTPNYIDLTGVVGWAEACCVLTASIVG